MYQTLHHLGHTLGDGESVGIRFDLRRRETTHKDSHADGLATATLSHDNHVLVELVNLKLEHNVADVRQVVAAKDDLEGSHQVVLDHHLHLSRTK